MRHILINDIACTCMKMKYIVKYADNTLTGGKYEET